MARLRRRRNMGDFVTLPGIPNSALRIADGTSAPIQRVGDQAGLPIPDNMLPALPNTTPTGYYAGEPYIKSWDGTSLVGACSPYPDAPCGACGPSANWLSVPDNNNPMVSGDSVVDENMVRDMLPGGSMAIGTAINPPTTFAFDLATPRAGSTLQRVVNSVLDPLVGYPTTPALSFQGGRISTDPVAGLIGKSGVATSGGSTQATSVSTGVLSDYMVISERNALAGLGADVGGRPSGADILKLLLGIGFVYWLVTSGK